MSDKKGDNLNDSLNKCFISDSSFIESDSKVMHSGQGHKLSISNFKKDTSNTSNARLKTNVRFLDDLDVSKKVIREDSREQSESYEGSFLRSEHGGNSYDQLGIMQSINEDEDHMQENPNYGKGEMPLDLYLEGTYENGQKTTLDPITVYRPKVEPHLITLKDGEQTYLHFNEKSYYKPDILRSLDSNDGFLGYYSKPETKKNQALKMLVCVTMYSEERVFLEQTLYHIFRNQKGFQDIGLKDFQIVVVVIQDGIMKMKEEVVDFYCDLEGENRNDLRNLKLRRYEIQRQIDFLEYKNQKKVLDSNEGLPNTIPKRTALVYQNRLQFVKDVENNKQERPKVYSSNHFHYNYNEPGLTVLSVFKHKNAKKLSSHMWFFEGFCRQFRPKYCALVDVGTLPAPDGLLKFYISMEGDSQLGGVCGFLGLEDPPEYDEQVEQMTPHMMELQEILDEKKKNLYEWQKRWKAKQNEVKQKQEQHAATLNNIQVNEALEEEKRQHFQSRMQTTKKFQYIVLLPFMLIKLLIGGIFWLISYIICSIGRGLRYFAVNYLDNFGSLKKAQLYEYTMAHMVDKNFESLLGFLHVLPGAWSAYRYEALEIKFSNRQNLLQKKYFKQLINPDKLEGNIKEANMFLAEDRILCLGIYCQPDSSFRLKFIPDAKAFTDPVGTLEEFMNQRRRWINSSLFALDYVLKHYKFHVSESNHSSFHKNFLLPFNMLFARIGDLNTYFIPAFYFFVAIMSSFQLMSPQVNKGFQYSPEEYEDQTVTCQIGMSLEIYDSLCDASQDLTTSCYYACEAQDYPKMFYLALDLIPAIYILSFMLIVFASLTFKIRLVGPNDYEKLRRTVLDEAQAATIKQMEADVSLKEGGIEQLTDNKEIKKLKKEVEKDKSDIRAKVFELSEFVYSTLVAKISEHHVKLNAKEKKFKIEYDRITSQEYANNVFKILATVMSLISMVIALVVVLAVLMNIFNSSFGIVKGFVKLGGWMRTYIIVMVLLNLGCFFMILLVHMMQPKLVWYIVSSYWSYIVYQPIYNFILIIFSFCNIDDVTWGTKGLSDSKDDNGYYLQKVKFLIRWFAANSILLLLFICGNVFTGQTPYIILGIGMYGTGYLTIKTVLAIISYVKYFLFNKMYYQYQVSKTKRANLDSQELLMQEYNTFISRMEQERLRSQSRYDFQIYHQNASVSGSVFSENLGLHARLQNINLEKNITPMNITQEKNIIPLNLSTN